MASIAAAPADPLFGPPSRQEIPNFWRHFHPTGGKAKKREKTEASLVPARVGKRPAFDPHIWKIRRILNGPPRRRLGGKKWGQIEASLAAIIVRKEGTGDWLWAVRDFRAILAE